MKKIPSSEVQAEYLLQENLEIETNNSSSEDVSEREQTLLEQRLKPFISNTIQKIHEKYSHLKTFRHKIALGIGSFALATSLASFVGQETVAEPTTNHPEVNEYVIDDSLVTMSNFQPPVLPANLEDIFSRYLHEEESSDVLSSYNHAYLNNSTDYTVYYRQVNSVDVPNRTSEDNTSRSATNSHPYMYETIVGDRLVYENSFVKSEAVEEYYGYKSVSDAKMLLADLISTTSSEAKKPPQALANYISYSEVDSALFEVDQDINTEVALEALETYLTAVEQQEQAGAYKSQARKIETVPQTTASPQTKKMYAPKPTPKSTAEAKYLGIDNQKRSWLTAAGIPENDWPYVDRIVVKESNWRWDLWNKGGSSAFGLCQRMMSVHGLQEGEKYMEDPVAQLVWCHNYAQERYGSWANAWAAWQKQHWW